MEKQHYKKKTTPEQELEICEKFEKGLSAKKLALEYGIIPITVYRILRKNKIKVQEQFGRGRVYNTNPNYFDSIDTEAKAYFLGLLYADGSVNVKKGFVTISLQEDDSYLLEEFIKEISPNSKLIKIVRQNPKWKPQLRLNLNSVELLRALIKIGCIPNKAKGMDFPNIPFGFLHHFVRGVFDGDGYVGYREQKGKLWKQFRVVITSCYSFLEGLKKELEKNNIRVNSIYRDKRSPYTASIGITGFQNQSDFYDFLYKDATIFLKRKEEKFKVIKTWI
jgi:intein-encoded DNA endonuclease-like protein